MFPSPNNWTENWSVTSEGEVSHARRRLYGSPDPARRDLNAPYSKQKRCSWGFSNGYQKETRGDFRLDSKSSLGSPVSVDKYDMMLQKSAENSSTNGRWRANTLEDPAVVKYEDSKVMGSDSLHTLNAEAPTKFTEKDKSTTLSEFATSVEQNQGVRRLAGVCGSERAASWYRIRNME